MALTIPVAHDFNCPWCWVGLRQAKRLEREFGVKIEWLPFEILPEEMEWPDPEPSDAARDKPSVPGRFELLLWAEGLQLPKVDRPRKLRTNKAHQVVEYVRSIGGDVGDIVERLYKAYWERGQNLSDVETLLELALGLAPNREDLRNAIESKRFQSRITAFDTDAHAKGVYNVPTFFVGELRLAEQPYTVLHKAVADLVGGPDTIDIYASLVFPDPPTDRPYSFVNMIETIDGKILSGKRDESVQDLGSKNDKSLMKRIERSAQAIMMGAGTLRATPKTWNPLTPMRIVVTKSGDIPCDHSFLTSGEGFVATPEDSDFKPPAGIGTLRAGNGAVDLGKLLRMLREHGIERLLVMGGSELNAQLFRAGLLDEIFVTVAPKIKLGRDVPTIADGEALDRRELLQYEIVENHQIENEVFLRYRRCS